MLGAASNQSFASYAAPLHSCKYRWLHAPATNLFKFPGTKRDNRSKKQGRSASRRQAKRSALLFQLTSSPPAARLHVQVALRSLTARVAEHQLNDPDVDASAM
jgi:hypothetical protein